MQVDEAVFEALFFAAQYSPRETGPASGATSLAPRARLHQIDEAGRGMSSWIALRRADVIGVFRGRNGSSIALLVPGRIDAAARRRSSRSAWWKPNEATDHADRSDDRRRIGDDLIGRTRRIM